MSTAARVVLVTCPASAAESFAERLVEERLVACANLLPVTSVYRWEGRVEKEPEALLVLKTGADAVARLEAFVRAEHPYDLPEFVVLTPEHVEQGYLGWVLEQTKPSS